MEKTNFLPSFILTSLKGFLIATEVFKNYKKTDLPKGNFVFFGTGVCACVCVTDGVSYIIGISKLL